MPANNRKGKEDFYTLSPSVPRRKGKADLLSATSNIANTTFNDENTFCPPCNNVGWTKHVTMVIKRKRVTIEIAREIYYNAVFRRGGQTQPAYDETCTFLFKHYEEQLALFLANKIERYLAMIKPSHPHKILRNISSPIQS